MKKLIKNIEIQKATSEIFLDAVKFFEESGVEFINSKKDHQHSLRVLIDDSLNHPMMITPFSFSMSRNALAKLYALLIKDEKFGGKRRVQMLIRCVNDCIREGYSKGKSVSYNIETGKYNEYCSTGKIVGLIFNIAKQAIKYSYGEYEIGCLGDVYSLLGGYDLCKMFFTEVFEAVEASIPEFGSVAAVTTLPNIKCYTCKYCMYNNDRRICSKVCTAISGIDYDSNPGRYTDAHHRSDVDALVSAIIDERIDRCVDYSSRIK